MTSEQDPCLEVIRPVAAPDASDLPTVEPCTVDDNCSHAEQKCCDTWSAIYLVVSYIHEHKIVWQ